MQNIKIKAFIYIFLAISIIALLIIIFGAGLDTSRIWTFIRFIPMVASIDLFLFGLFAKWGWRWKIFRGWLVPFPDLTGTWEGTIKSTWLEPQTGKESNPIPVILSIKQSFTNISCVMRTKEMTSYSYSGSFNIDVDNQIRKLTYSYYSRPNLSLEASNIRHDGTTTFDITGNPVSKLSGSYWTTRKSTGEINLMFREKRILEEIPTDFNP